MNRDNLNPRKKSQEYENLRDFLLSETDTIVYFNNDGVNDPNSKNDVVSDLLKASIQSNRLGLYPIRFKNDVSISEAGVGKSESAKNQSYNTINKLHITSIDNATCHSVQQNNQGIKETKGFSDSNINMIDQEIFSNDSRLHVTKRIERTEYSTFVVPNAYPETIRKHIDIIDAKLPSFMQELTFSNKSNIDNTDLIEDPWYDLLLRKLDTENQKTCTYHETNTIEPTDNNNHEVDADKEPSPMEKQQNTLTTEKCDSTQSRYKDDISIIHDDLEPLNSGCIGDNSSTIRKYGTFHVEQHENAMHFFDSLEEKVGVSSITHQNQKGTSSETSFQENLNTNQKITVRIQDDNARSHNRINNYEGSQAVRCNDSNLRKQTSL